MKNRHYSAEYKYYKDKIETYACFYVKSVIQVLKELNLKLDSKILDVGCGAGNLINILYNLGFSNVWGFDASESGIHIARESYPKIIDKFFIHDIYGPKLPHGIPQTYDLIISAEVLEHLYSPEGHIKNIYNWLNKSGYLIILTPYHGYIKNLIISLLNRFDRHFNPLWRGGHIKFYSKKTLFFLLNTRGFNMVKFKGIGRVPYIWKLMMLVARRKE